MWTVFLLSNAHHHHHHHQSLVPGPTPRAAGGRGVRRCGLGSNVLRRAVGLARGQPLQGEPEKNSPVMPAPHLPQLLSSLQTVQQQAQTLPAGPRPPTHCCQPHRLPQCNGDGSPRHLASGGEPRQRGVMQLPEGWVGGEVVKWGGSEEAAAAGGRRKKRMRRRRRRRRRVGIPSPWQPVWKNTATVARATAAAVASLQTTPSGERKRRFEERHTNQSRQTET